MAVLAENTACPPEHRPLTELAARGPDDLGEQVTAAGRSVLDLPNGWPAELLLDGCGAVTQSAVGTAVRLPPPHRF